jgi:hypothetical protein
MTSILVRAETIFQRPGLPETVGHSYVRLGRYYHTKPPCTVDKVWKLRPCRMDIGWEALSSSDTAIAQRSHLCTGSRIAGDLRLPKSLRSLPLCPKPAIVASLPRRTCCGPNRAQTLLTYRICAVKSYSSQPPRIMNASWTSSQ